MELLALKYEIKHAEHIVRLYSECILNYIFPYGKEYNRLKTQETYYNGIVDGLKKQLSIKED